MRGIYLWSAGIWLLFAALAVINGTIREATYKKRVGDLAAHQISTVLFISAILIIMHLFFNRSGLAFSSAELWMIGSCWLIATIAFELVFGHLVAGHSWAELLKDYNLLKGRVWSLVLIFTLIGPWLVRTMLGKNI